MNYFLMFYEYVNILNRGNILSVVQHFITSE